MNAALVILFIICVVLLLESISVCVRRAIVPSPIRAIKKLFLPKSQFDAGDGLILLLIITLGLGVYLTRDRLKNLIIPTSEITQGTTQELPMQPKTQRKNLAVYENEVFGSTINKMLVRTQFNPTDAMQNDFSVVDGTVTEGYIFGDKDTETTLFSLSRHQYNQFSGDHEAVFHVRYMGNETEDQPMFIARATLLDSGTVISEVQVAAKDLFKTRQWTTITLPYTVTDSGAAPVISLISTGQAYMELQQVEIQKVDKNLETMATQDLFPDTPDASASEGYARFADPIQHLPGTMLFGPYDATLRAGDYAAEFRVKIADAEILSPLPLIRLQTTAIQEGQKTQRETTKDLTIADFTAQGEYQSFTLPLTIRAGEVAEFRAYFYDRSKVWVDNISLYPADENNVVDSDDILLQEIEMLRQEIDELKRMNNGDDVNDADVLVDDLVKDTLNVSDDETMLPVAEKNEPLQPEKKDEPAPGATSGGSDNKLETSFGVDDLEEDTAEQQFVITYPKEDVKEEIKEFVITYPEGLEQVSSDQQNPADQSQKGEADDAPARTTELNQDGRGSHDAAMGEAATDEGPEENTENVVTERNNTRQSNTFRRIPR